MKLKFQSHEKLYALCSAIRGCDLCDERNSYNRVVIKKHITGRIRYIVFRIEISTNYGAIYTYHPMTKDECTEVLGAIRRCAADKRYHHFIQHLFLAVDATWKHKVWGKHGAELSAALRGD